MDPPPSDGTDRSADAGGDAGMVSASASAETYHRGRKRIGRRRRDRARGRRASRGRACASSPRASRSKAGRWRRRWRPGTGRSSPRRALPARRRRRGRTPRASRLRDGEATRGRSRRPGRRAHARCTTSSGSRAITSRRRPTRAQFGPVRADALKAKVLLVYWPPRTATPGQVAIARSARSSPRKRSRTHAIAGRARRPHRRRCPDHRRAGRAPVLRTERSSPDSPRTRSLPASPWNRSFAGPRDQQVVAGSGARPVLADRALELVVATQPEERVGAASAAQLVVAGRADDVHERAEASHELIGAGVAPSVAWARLAGRARRSRRRCRRPGSAPSGPSSASGPPFGPSRRESGIDVFEIARRIETAPVPLSDVVAEAPHRAVALTGAVGTVARDDRNARPRPTGSRRDAPAPCRVVVTDASKRRSRHDRRATARHLRRSRCSRRPSCSRAEVSDPGPDQMPPPSIAMVARRWRTWTRLSTPAFQMPPPLDAASFPITSESTRRSRAPAATAMPPPRSASPPATVTPIRASRPPRTRDRPAHERGRRARRRR